MNCIPEYILDWVLRHFQNELSSWAFYMNWYPLCSTTIVEYFLYKENSGSGVVKCKKMVDFVHCGDLGRKVLCLS